MPLLGTKRFKCQSVPENLHPEDEVYVCKATGEVFTDYEKFFDQTILCNSLIWTCEVTGHTGMTFTEALESERNSRRQLETFPSHLRLPILHLVSLTRRTIFKDLLDDIFSFVKDRYFIGENVSITTGSDKKNAVVIKVFPMTNSFNQPLGDTSIEEHVMEDVVTRKSSTKRCATESSSFQYMSQDQNTGIAIMSTTKNMSRNRSLFNRDSCKLFLKEHCEHKGKGVWRLKESVINKYNLVSVKFNDYFAGPIPIFPGVDETEQKNLNHQGRDNKDSGVKLKKETETAKDWIKPRDDLLCDDLKDLPASTPVLLFGSNFGSAVTIMEFLTCFSSFCGIELPDNYSICDFEKCLKEQDSSSFFLDLIQGLILAIFQMQLGISEIHQAWKVAARDQSDLDLQFGLSLVRFFQSVEKKSKSQKYQALQDTPLRQLPLDGSSMTEVLRMHLLVGSYEATSHSDCSSEVKIENVALEFSRLNPEIMRHLQVGNLLDLKPDEKLKLLNTLIDQVLSLPACRDYIEEKYNKLKANQKELRTHIWAVQKREKDLLNYNFKKKQEEDVSTGGEKKENVSKSYDAVVTRAKKSILDLKDKDFEEMPMEGIDWDQLSQEEKDHIKNWSEKRQMDLQNIVEAAQSDCCVTPMGMDRTYRRYWIFKSVPGLFVEDSKAQDFTIPSSCLNLIPQNQNKIKNREAHNLESNTLQESQEKSLIFINAQEQLANRGKTEWSFYSTPGELQCLIESLNTRGHRENHLKNCLIRSKQKILNSMTLCEVEPLTKLEEELENNGKENQNEISILSPQRTMKGELELRRTIADLLIDLEERVFAGSLGQLKRIDIDRKEWKKELETLTHAHNSDGVIDCSDKVEAMSPCQIICHLGKCLSEIMDMVDSKFLGPPLGDNEEMKQKKLKLAELQQQQLQQHQQQQQRTEGIESIDRIEDLEASNSQESFQSHNAVPSNHLIQLRADTSKWKELVNKCSNFSQLYLCLVLLDSSIAWSRSALNARCKVCRKKKDGESMLLCDGCDQGHHMYCLRPSLKDIPEGDWFCPSCQPKNFIMINPRKTTKNVRYKDYDSDYGGDEEDDDDDEEESFSSTDLNEGTQNEWKEDLNVKRSNPKRRGRDIVTTKKINGSLFTKRNDAAITTTKSHVVNQCPLTSLNHHHPEEPPLIIPPTSQPIKSRSGREIIRPKGIEQFMEEELSATRVKKRERSFISNHDDDLYMPKVKKRRNIKNSRYSDDFDYDNEESEGGEEEAYLSRRKGQKKKKHLHSDESQAPRSKRSNVSTSKHSPRKTNASMKAIEDLVTDLMKNDEAWPFLKPVTLKQAPDYFNIIEKPIDLSTIKYKIYRFEYEDQNQIIDDLRLMLYNCNLYNCPDTPVHDAGTALETYLDKRLEEIEKNSTRLATSSHSKRTSV